MLCRVPYLSGQYGEQQNCYAVPRLVVPGHTLPMRLWLAENCIQKWVNTKPSSVHMAKPIYPRKIQSILDKRKNCSAIGQMEITLVWVQKERCTLIFKSLLEWPGLFDLSFAVSASLSPFHNVFTAKRFCLYCVQDHLFCQIVLCVMSCFVRVAPVMIHGLNVKKQSCGFDSGKNEAAFTLAEKIRCFANIWHRSKFDAHV